MVRRAVWSVLAACCLAPAGHAQSTHTYDALIAAHAAANGVPETLVRRVILRESRYQPSLVGRGGTIGLMQIKLATARGLGYTGNAEGLRDPDTNLAYGVKYLAGAYEAAKRRRLEANANPQPPLDGGAARKHAVTAHTKVPSAPLSVVPDGAKAT